MNFRALAFAAVMLGASATHGQQNSTQVIKACDVEMHRFTDNIAPTRTGWIWRYNPNSTPARSIAEYHDGVATDVVTATSATQTGLRTAILQCIANTFDPGEKHDAERMLKLHDDSTRVDEQTFTTIDEQAVQRLRDTRTADTEKLLYSATTSSRHGPPLRAQ